MTSRIWTPRADQRLVLDWLAGRDRGAVFAPTGSGKTVLASTWMHDRLFGRMSAGRAAIIAPPLVVDGWLRQFAQWRHLAGLAETTTVVPPELLGLRRVKRASGPGGMEFADKRATKKRLRELPGRVHLISWTAFSWVEEAWGASWPYDMVIFDESTFVKDRASARGRAARRAVHKSGVVEHLMLLTATPNSNGDEALFAQMDLVERGCLGSGLQDFRETYCVPDQRNWSTGQVYRWKLAPAMRPAFEAVVARLSISVPESLGIDVLEVEHLTPMPDSVRAEYRELKRKQVLGDVTAANAAVLTAKLRQIAGGGAVYADDGTARMMHDTKIEKLRELLDEVPGQVVVAFHWQFELDALKDSLKDTFKDIRVKGAKEDFLSGRIRVLGIHPQSAAHGVDQLQGVCNNIVWLSVPVDRELYDQANGRLKRTGQAERTVFVHVLVTPDTEEERVWREVLPAKAANADRLLQATRVGATVAG